MTFDKIHSDDESGELRDKVILLHGFSGKQVNQLIKSYQQNTDLPKAHFAVITPMTRVKRIKEVIQDIVADAQAE